MLHVMHFPVVLTRELCIQGTDPPGEFIRRNNNNQCPGWELLGQQIYPVVFTGPNFGAAEMQSPLPGDQKETAIYF